MNNGKQSEQSLVSSPELSLISLSNHFAHVKSIDGYIMKKHAHAI